MASRSIEQIIDRQLHRWDHFAATLGYGRAASQTKPADTRVHPVICISREYGTGTGEVLDLLSKALDCEIFGRDIIDHIAKDLNVQRRIIDILDERLRSEVEAHVEGMMRGRTIDKREYFLSLVRVIRSVAKRGQIIILGRGSNLILGHDATLSVRLVAPVEHRAKYLMEKKGVTESEAQDEIEKIDKGRRDFVKHFFHADIDEPSGYDTVLNTDRFAPEKCVAIILEALKQRGVKV